MGKIIVAMYLTLDGVMEEPSWTAPYWDDEIAKFQLNLLFRSDALLLGRVTYEGFAAAWPSAEDQEGFANRMNQLPKYVASTTLKRTEWNARLITSNVAQEVAKLKKTGQRLLVYGSAELIETLLKHDLIDEMHLMTFPLILGEGKRLFKENADQKMFNLKEIRSTDAGVLIASYTPDR
ncbi:pyrimidine reductase [Planococcus antarcticus DSM 14505]|uniref:Pyrimidine reductase n=1 Tax=Planococcus antarcticus DSM 14505 TaxID=1185653 RepID=A0A1C7DDE3_9BACL|nr:dihydrofolate reductase family protein [Planococcus antarcticus]ANU09464.1 pyrimidine reductase [Planococcus antarcticus DSM 14505]EIM06237.1 pyrimidine reductase [Planococcus antarcticus DSM 14505]